MESGLRQSEGQVTLSGSQVEQNREEFERRFEQNERQIQQNQRIWIAIAKHLDLDIGDIASEATLEGG